MQLLPGNARLSALVYPRQYLVVFPHFPYVRIPILLVPFIAIGLADIQVAIYVSLLFGDERFQCDPPLRQIGDGPHSPGFAQVRPEYKEMEIMILYYAVDLEHAAVGARRIAIRRNRVELFAILPAGRGEVMGDE